MSTDISWKETADKAIREYGILTEKQIEAYLKKKEIKAGTTQIYSYLKANKAIKAIKIVTGKGQRAYCFVKPRSHNKTVELYMHNQCFINRGIEFKKPTVTTSLSHMIARIRFLKGEGRLSNYLLDEVEKTVAVHKKQQKLNTPDSSEITALYRLLKGKGFCYFINRKSVGTWIYYDTGEISASSLKARLEALNKFVDDSDGQDLSDTLTIVTFNKKRIERITGILTLNIQVKIIEIF